MADDILLEPIKAYKTVYKQAVNDEAIRYFDELVTKSGIDVEANRKTIKEIKKTEEEINNANKKLGSLKAGRGWLIALIVILFITSLVCMGTWFLELSEEYPLYLTIPIFIAGIAIGISLIVVIVKTINPKIKDIDNLLSKLKEKLNGLIEVAKTQMAPLNALYDWNMATTIIEKVIPILDFDKYFDGSKYVKLCEEYGFDVLNDVDHSTLYCQSGTILGNPYLIQKQRVHAIENKAYTGSITISWTEYYYDSKGNRQSRYRTQVLTATTYHPAPVYRNEVALIYGNHAAPDLSFTRAPNGLGEKSQKEIDRYVRSHTDDLYKKAEKSLSKGGKPFTPLANTEFELLLDALDRDHDVQFRLLYTPLGQKNTMELLKSKEGYGDDFYFYKRKRVNIISSRHSQGEDLSGSPHIFIGYDHDVARKTFVDYVNNFFKVIYFDFAPLLSIPLYQQMKTIDYIYGDDAPSNYSSYEHEVFSNSFDENLLKNPLSITPAILKTNIISKDGKSDKYKVTAHSYRGEDRVDYVNKMGGDGHMHTIPVYWTEYIPIEQESIMELRNTNASRHEFNNKIKAGRLANFISRNSHGGYYSFQRGLVALLSANNYGTNEDKELDSIFDEKDE